MGLIFMQETRSPAGWSSLATEEVTTPLPRPDITPPVTKMYFMYCRRSLGYYLLGGGGSGASSGVRRTIQMQPAISRTEPATWWTAVTRYPHLRNRAHAPACPDDASRSWRVPSRPRRPGPVSGHRHDAEPAVHASSVPFHYLRLPVSAGVQHVQRGLISPIRP